MLLGKHLSLWSMFSATLFRLLDFLAMWIFHSCGYFSLDDGRIELDQSTPNTCSIKIANVTEEDNGAWKITSLLCSRGRGTRYENAFLAFKGTYLRDILYTTKYLASWIWFFSSTNLIHLSELCMGRMERWDDMQQIMRLWSNNWHQITAKSQNCWGKLHW